MADGKTKIWIEIFSRPYKEFIFLGFFSMILGLIALYIQIENLGQFAITFGLGLVAWGIGCLSILLANKSDKKMQSISTADFYEITYRFWDRAPKLYKEQRFEVRDTYSWQLGNLFRHGEKLKDWADLEVQDKLIKEFKIFLERLRPNKCNKYWIEVKNYIEICKIAIGFKTKNDNIKDDLIEELGKWIGKKAKEESNHEYLKRKINELSKMKKNEIFK